METYLLNLRYSAEIDRDPFTLVALALPRSDDFVTLLVGALGDDTVGYELCYIVAISSRRVLWRSKKSEVAILRATLDQLRAKILVGR